MGIYANWRTCIKTCNASGLQPFAVCICVVCKVLEDLHKLITDIVTGCSKHSTKNVGFNLSLLRLSAIN